MIQATRNWLKMSESPLARGLFKTIKSLMCFSLPAPKWLFAPLYLTVIFFKNIADFALGSFLWTPMFKGRLSHVGAQLYLYGGLPYVCGPLVISIGNQCRISGKTTFSGRVHGKEHPTLTLGNNIDIGWQTTISVGTQVVLCDNVRIASGAFLAGYPGHPLNPEDRAKGLPELDAQCGDIILEKDVWLATNVTVLAGVTIGEGTVVASGSVVTSNLPAFVLAGGVPAKILRTLTQKETETLIKEETGKLTKKETSK